jgi:hypothetical protein
MSHNTNPHGQGNYGIMPGARDNHAYDGVNEKLHLGDTVDDLSAVELQDMRNRHLVDVHVYAASPAEIAQMAADQQHAVNTAVQQANAIDDAEDSLSSLEQNFPVVAGDNVPVPGAAAPDPNANNGPMAAADNDKNRGRYRAAYMCGGLLIGGVVSAGVTMLAIWLDGWAKAATPKIVVNVTFGGGAAKPTPAEAVLKAWLAYDDESFFKVLRGLIADAKTELTLDNMAYVCSYLSTLYDQIFPLDKNTDYASARVPQSQIDSDYSALKTAGMTVLNVFDKSADYPDPSMVDSTVIKKFGRGVRLAYLRAMYDKAVMESMQPATAPGT